MARAAKLKRGSVIKTWIIEEELTWSGLHHGNGGTVLAVRVGRERLAGYVISNLHVESHRFAIKGEPGEWQLQQVGSIDWAEVNGTPARRIYRLVGRILRESETIPPLVEGL